MKFFFSCGYGWIIVIASFAANLLVDGIIFTTGQTLLGIWENDFQTTAMAASWAQSLLGGCYLLAGPLASALANHFGCRLVCIIGAVLAFTGFTLSALVPALPILYFTFGVLGGVGFGLVYLPAIVIVNQYFEKRRALALGIAVCGSGIGTTIFSQVFPFLLRLNGQNWRTFLVNVAFINLLCIPCGLCFRNLQPNEMQIEEVTKIAMAYHESHPDANKKCNLTSSSERLKSPHIAGGIPIERFASSEQVGNKYSSQNRPFLSSIELNAAKRSDRNVWSQERLVKTVSKESLMEVNKPLSRMDIFYSGSVTNLSRRFTNSHVKNQDNGGNRSPYLSNLALSTECVSGGGVKWTRGVQMALKSLLDFSLLKSITFIVLNIGGFLTTCCLFVPFLYLGEKSSSIGTSLDEQSYLLLSLGLINIFARILCGIISDLPSVDPLMVSNLAVIAGGIATMLVPLFTHYWMYLAYTVPFALAIACFSALRSVICVELLGLERLSSAFGIVLLFMGFAALTGPPLAAAIKDFTGDFDASFYTMGSLMAISGIICLPLRRLNAYEVKRSNKNSNFHNESELQMLNVNSVNAS
ncbi:unnamed protein product [Dracunculus medinensis]|uniref:MFS domain-containing protein n=1 Tax=Dracunculus medinensis TaxID=318479 RepID=A0A158Q5B1_DRAME|nr:unnamed protein product [Dracunculus medinensis]